MRVQQDGGFGCAGMSSPKWGGILHNTLTRVNYPELEVGVIAVSHNSYNDSLAIST